MSGTQKAVMVIGRILMSLIFIIAAIHKIFDWNGSEEALSSQLNQALDAYKNIDWLHDGIEYLLPWTSVMLLMGLVCELIGSLLVFFGTKVRLGALLILLFLIPTTFLFHGFWALTGEEKQLQMIMFLKNLSICGALLVLLSIGSGPKKFEPVSFSDTLE